MARIVGGLGISHTPSMGFEYDKGIASGAFSPEWQPWYDGTRPVKAWLEQLAPDQIVVVYNDHFNQFTFDAYPTLAAGVADTFPQADESWALRPVPDLNGDTAFAWPLVTSLVHQGFDLTICQEMEIDHGIFSWFTYLFDAPWPAPILPIAVNMLRHPLPTSRRIWQLGEAIRAAVEDLPGDERVLVVATGGMSHQIVGTRFGMANEDLDQFFLAHLRDDPQRLLAIPQEELMRVGGTEAAELSMWFAMRAALSKDVREHYRYYTFPKITGCGVIAFEEVTRR
jgi:aromatic ring-opening dioxygenase catalytic subunit (LigB family)